MEKNVNRRKFLSAAAVAAFAPMAFASVFERRKKVVVVGSGLSGLSCAYELRKRDFEAELLEGQGRAGGRIQTPRDGLNPELSAEPAPFQEPTSSKTANRGVSAQSRMKPEMES